MTYIVQGYLGYQWPFGFANIFSLFIKLREYNIYK